jgi:glc operon protein GlcG
MAQVAPPSTPYGVPIVAGGKIVGGIGVSGVASHEDAQVAMAGAAAVGSG